MTITETRAVPPALEIDLILYLSALLQGWRVVLGTAFTIAIIVAGYTWTLPDIYEAFVRTSVVDLSDPGGIKPDERRAAEVLTLVEHGFVMGINRDNHLEVTLARLRSRKFTAEFMEHHNVHQALYAEHWDPLLSQWKNNFVPDSIEAFKWFSERIRYIDHNPETDIITISIRWTDRALARDWANAYVQAFNDHIRRKTLNEVKRKQAYLRATLAKSDLVDIEKSIYRLIEAQTAIEMLANSRQEFALEVIDPATIPYDRFSPAPRRMTVFAFVAGAMLACCGLIGRVMLTRVGQQLQLLTHPTTRKTANDQ